MTDRVQAAFFYLPQIPKDNVHQVVKIVRDPTGQSAEALHFLRLPKLLFEPFFRFYFE